MSSDPFNGKLVAVVGAGPAGLYAARKLAVSGAKVVIFNRDLKPGGLAEYGIYFSKYKMKKGLRKQFTSILSHENITYYGGVTVGRDGDLTLQELEDMGFQSILVTVGAQGTKWLGLEGEGLKGVYHAKDLVYHYNKLPPYSSQNFKIGDKAALIGAGNVMIDIARWMIRVLGVKEVSAIVRRGPAEVKFTKVEMASVISNLDMEAFETEFERVGERMSAVGQNPEEAKAFILAAQKKAYPPKTESKFNFKFLSSPKAIHGDETGKVKYIEVENTKLIPKNGDTKAVSLGTTEMLEVDTVVFCIGDRVDQNFGLPVEWNEFVKNPDPVFPQKDVSYEVFNPETNTPVESVFVAGWSRKASDGLVGMARKDGEFGAEAVMDYLQDKPPIANISTILNLVKIIMDKLPHPVADKEDILRLTNIELREAELQGLEDFKFGSNREMAQVLGKR